MATAASRSDALVVVVPCFNEAGRLHGQAFHDFVASEPRASLLLVDDGSRDATLARLREIAAGSERIEVLALPENRGKGEAVRAGLRAALRSAPRYVGFWDADLSTPLPVAREFAAYLDANPEVRMAIGSRVQMLGHRIRRRPARHYFGRVAATAVSAILSAPVYDSQCGAKLIRVDASLCQILEAPSLTRWLFDVELLARVAKAEPGPPEQVLNRRVREIPLHEWVDVEGSRIRARDLWLLPRDLLRIWRAYR